jgi:hypothetical protein
MNFCAALMQNGILRASSCQQECNRNYSSLQGAEKQAGTGSTCMEILRYKSDAWGQRVLEGASWDLIWVFVAAAVVFIIFHAVYTHRKLKRRQNDE